MKVNFNNNIIYKDQITHKRKSNETNRFSTQNILRETPLERDAKVISFKGVSFLEKILYKNTSKINLENSKNILKGTVGSAIERLEAHARKTDGISEHIIETVKDGEKLISFREKTPIRLLWDGIKYPFTELPFHLIKATTDTLASKKIIKKIDWHNMDGFVAKKINALENDDILNSFNGSIQIANKYKNVSEKDRSAGLFNTAMKMFDPKTGNYNGVHERALTRIVTGFIPAFFLANDAYNLSRLCDDDKKAADKEKKLRFNQESKRVISNAYIQLITLGALSKFINSSKKAFITTTILTTAFTEIYSRLSNGKKIHFISKEEAKKINAENAKKEGNSVKDEPKIEDKTKEEKKENISNIRPAFKGNSKTFQDFGLASTISFANSENVAKTNTTAEKEEKQTKKELKPLLSLGTITKWVVGTIAAGFALKYTKKIELKNGRNIGEYFQKVSKQYDKLYKKITEKEHTITKQDFENIYNKLKKYDSNLAEKYKNVTMQYQQATAVEKIASDFAKELKQFGLDDIVKELSEIGNKDLPEKIQKARKNKVIRNQFDFFYKLLKDNGYEQVANELKNDLINADNTINTKLYNQTVKKLKKLSTQEEFKGLRGFMPAFDNVFKVDKKAENLKTFKIITGILSEKAQSNPELAKVNAKYFGIVRNSTNKENLTLGKQKIRFVREGVDFIVEPFKFLWSTITLPYNIANRFVKSFEPGKLPEWTEEITGVSNSVKKLKEKVQLDDKNFKKYMDKQINKAFNSITMSGLSNSELSALSKNAATAATMTFLVADNYNMVMLKSNGENKEEATLKAKERVVQETSRLFYQQLFINLFNNTFRSVYNNSLLGAQAVNTASTTIGEYFTRKAIGMPIKESSRDEILKQEQDNLNSKGPKGKFFRFMSRLTGKQVLSEREQKK